MTARRTRSHAYRPAQDTRTNVRVQKRRTIVAVIDGRGFGHRPADLNRMLKACEGHVYTLDELKSSYKRGGPLRPYVGTRGSLRRQDALDKDRWHDQRCIDSPRSPTA